MNQILDIVWRAGVVYLVVLLGLRLLGKRHVAQLSIIDFVLILLISNAVQNAMVGTDSSLLGGVVAAVTLLILNYVLTLLIYRFKSTEQLLLGTPTLLIHNGVIITEHLVREKITVEEMEQVIREHGLEDSSQVKNAIMELDGTISVIPKEGGERHIETFKHRRMKYQQRKF